ncbi:MAG: MATE family efflux transporter [Candidatus Cloacimonetes bacterium]|nr:MATE family efflux transporter [Candidatus Cloacimonadota bacterium]
MKDLTEGSVFNHILKFSMPMLLGSVFQQLYNVVDSVIVGQFLGNSSLAAVGASFPVIFVLISMIMGLTMGMSVVISQYYGAKDMHRVKQAIDTMMIFVITSGLIVGIFGYFFSEKIFIWMNFPQEVVTDAAVYFRILIAGVIFMFGYNGMSSILRGLGDSKTPLYFLMVTTILNILLDLLFVLVFKWGIAGVSIATVISQGVSFLGMIIWLNKKHDFINIKFINLEFDKEIFRKSVKIGFPAGVQQTIVALSAVALTSIVGGFGTETVAGFAVAIRIDSFAMMPAMNISIALTNFVGQNVGAGKIDRIKKGYKAALSISCGISFILGLIFLTLGMPLVSFFTPDPAVQLVGTQFLMTCSMFYIFVSAMFMTNGVLRGAGDATAPMLNTMIALWCVRIPVAIILSQGWKGVSFLGYELHAWEGLGSRGIWWGAPISWVVGFLLAYSRYRGGKWKTKSVVQK